MFTKEQLERLSAPLDRSRVASRSQAGRSLSYLEGYDVMDTANDIFGFGNWNYEVINLKEVSKIEGVDKYNKPQFRVGYEAIVKVTVVTEESGIIVRSDVGYGSGIGKELFDCYEGAGKEAVTDAFKRAMRGFGNQFGNALYDKQQRNVVDTEVIDEHVEVVTAKGGKVTQVVDYKAQVVQIIKDNGVPEEQVVACAKACIDAGLDISSDPKGVLDNNKAELIESIKLFLSIAA